LHPDFLPHFGASVSNVIDWLTSRGYHLRSLDAGEASLTLATTFFASVR